MSAASTSANDRHDGNAESGSRRVNHHSSPLRPIHILSGFAIVLAAFPVAASAQSKTLPVRLSPAIARIDADKENLSRVGPKAVSATGVLAIYLPQDGNIRLFAPSGTGLATFGRKGSAPGEMRTVSALGWLADSLWFVDPSLNRVTLFTQTGKVIRTSVLPTAIQPAQTQDRSPKYGRPFVQALLADGSFLATASEFVGTSGASVGAPATVTWVLRISPTGAVRQVVGLEPSNPCHVGNAVAEVMLPLCAKPLTGYSADGRTRAVVTPIPSHGADGGYRVMAFNEHGDTLMDRTVTAKLDPVSSVTADSVRRAFDSMPPSIRDLEARASLPRYHPPVTEVHVAIDGSVWIGLRIRPLTDIQEWQVFDSRGKTQPSVWLMRYSGPAIGPQGAWAIEASPDGLESIVLRRAR